MKAVAEIDSGEVLRGGSHRKYGIKHTIIADPDSMPVGGIAGLGPNFRLISKKLVASPSRSTIWAMILRIWAAGAGRWAQYWQARLCICRPGIVQRGARAQALSGR